MYSHILSTYIFRLFNIKFPETPYAISISCHKYKYQVPGTVLLSIDRDIHGFIVKIYIIQFCNHDNGIREDVAYRGNCLQRLGQKATLLLVLCWYLYLYKYCICSSHLESCTCTEYTGTLYYKYR